MSSIKFFLVLTFLGFGKPGFSQPAPEHYIFFNVKKAGEILNDANAKFRLYEILK